jgi:hypothetical protein
MLISGGFRLRSTNLNAMPIAPGFDFALLRSTLDRWDLIMNSGEVRLERD